MSPAQRCSFQNPLAAQRPPIGDRPAGLAEQGLQFAGRITIDPGVPTPIGLFVEAGMAEIDRIIARHDDARQPPEQLGNIEQIFQQAERGRSLTASAGRGSRFKSTTTVSASRATTSTGT